MKNRTMALLLAVSLMAPAASVLASAGDSSTQGPNGTTTGTPASNTKNKKHHGHHHKKPAATPAANTGGMK